MLNKLLTLLAIASFLVPRTSTARVTRFVVTQTRIFAGGMSFGSVGPYERLDGTAYFEVDPKDPLNAVIVDLDKAPRNARGLVEFSSPFFILKPVDVARGNHKIFVGLNNRGNKIEINLRSFPPAPNTNDPLTAADIGNNLLLELGYSVVDAGWQGDVAPGNNRLFPDFPTATQPGGDPIVAPVRIEYSDRTIPQGGTFTLTLEGSPSFKSYPTADMNTAHSTLTVRDGVSDHGPMTPIPSDQWAFGTCPTGQASLVANDSNICLFSGFKPDQLYMLIYPAKNPIVMGLAYAVPRDLASFLRNQAQDDFGNRNPLATSPTHVGIRRAYLSGTSSTGMYMREFLYLGFNEDESHRKVFEAVHVNISGTHRLFANVEFADPNTYSRQDSRHDFLSTSYPPLTYTVATDPVSAIRDGILKRPEIDPVVFEVDTANEFWNMKASLNVADGLGNPVPIPENVRLYFLSSYSHLGADGLFSPSVTAVLCQHVTHAFPGGYQPSERALLVALDEWADRGIEPPRSNYPQLRGSTLIPRAEAAEDSPRIPGVDFPTLINELELLDFGPLFNPVGGVLTLLPPVLGPRYQLFVPKPDEDGLDIAGIRPMEIRVPLGTNTGWNIRAPGHLAPNLCSLNGSFFPFATTKAERLASGDPRKSLEERYHTHVGFVRSVRQGAKQLVQERFLLPQDAVTWINAAEASTVLK
jgi:hypothetical protein